MSDDDYKLLKTAHTIPLGDPVRLFAEKVKGMLISDIRPRGQTIAVRKAPYGDKLSEACQTKGCSFAFDQGMPEHNCGGEYCHAYEAAT